MTLFEDLLHLLINLNFQSQNKI